MRLLYVLCMNVLFQIKEQNILYVKEMYSASNL